MNWQKILSRLSIPGVALLVLGAVACTQAPRVCKTTPSASVIRIIGLALALAGALILLDFIPGL